MDDLTVELTNSARDRATDPPANQPPPASVSQPLRQLLEKRLSDLRSQVTDLRNKLSNDKPQSSSFARLNEVELQLDVAQESLENPAANLSKVSEALKNTRNNIDQVCQELATHTKTLATCLGLYAVVIFVATAMISFYLWKATGATGAVPEFVGFGPLDQRWLILRSALLSVCGSLIGSSIYLFRILYQSLSGRSFDPRRVRWYYIAPVFAAALSVAIFAFVRAGLPGFGSGGAAQGMGVAAAGPFAIGFLIGFAPSTVLYRVTGVVKAIFGTDEVSGPQVAPPTVQIRNGQAEVSTVIVASSASRITAVSVLLHTTATGTTPVAEMRKGSENTWAGEFPLPEEVLKDMKIASVLVEARDDTGNVARCEPVPLANVPQTGAAGADRAVPDTVKSEITTAPRSGEVIDPTDPLIIHFPTPMLDVDPGLLALSSEESEEGDGIELRKQWNQEMTKLTLDHDELPPGDYRLVLELLQLPDGTEMDQHVQVDFKVEAASP